MIYKYPKNETNFIELNDNISRKTMRVLSTSDGEEFFNAVKNIIISFSLTNDTGQTITSIDSLTEEFMDNTSYVLIEWCRTLPLLHVRNIINISNELKKSLFTTTVTVQSTE